MSVEWEFTASRFELLADLIDCLGPVCDFAVEIQAANCPTIHTILPAILRLTESTLAMPAKNRAKYSRRSNDAAIAPTPL